MSSDLLLQAVKGWECSSFPVVCEFCLGSSKRFVNMSITDDGMECKICKRRCTVFRWRSRPYRRHPRPKMNEICKSCSKLNEVCQRCLLPVVEVPRRYLNVPPLFERRDLSGIESITQRIAALDTSQDDEGPSGSKEEEYKSGFDK